VPVNRSSTTLLPSARVTISAMSVPIAASRAGSVAPRRRPPRIDAAAQQPVTADLVVEAQELFADTLGVGVEDGVPDVVAQRADVGDVIVEPFELQQDGRSRRARAAR